MKCAVGPAQSRLLVTGAASQKGCLPRTVIGSFFKSFATPSELCRRIVPWSSGWLDIEGKLQRIGGGLFIAQPCSTKSRAYLRYRHKRGGEEGVVGLP